MANRGGERVLERLCNLYPQADIFTHVYDPTVNFNFVGRHKIITSFISKLPFSKRFYQHYLPLMPMAIEQMNLTDYDLIISSEAGPAKGAIRHPNATHICYVHSPMRYIWDQYSLYYARFGLIPKIISPALFHYMRNWDYTSAQRIDSIAVNSAFVGRRVQNVWRRESTVVYPPVSVSDFEASPNLVGSYYLWVGQLVPYKRPELAVDVCTRLKVPLLVVGVGAMKADLIKRAGPTVYFVDRLPFLELRKHFAQCRALLYTGEEDFGITPVEVMASGRPIIALGSGGALETVLNGRTGLFFDSATFDGLEDAVRRFDLWIKDFCFNDALEQASHFSVDRFDESFKKFASSCGF